MRNSEDEIDPNSRKDLKMLAMDFLKAITRVVKSETGMTPLRMQRSKWMVGTGPNTESSREFTREIPDDKSIWKSGLVYFYKSFNERQQLMDFLGAIPRLRDLDQLNAFILPLVNNWLKLKDPFGFKDSDITELLEEFSDAVLYGKLIIRSRTAINGIDVANLPLSLEGGIDIHQISDDELWELGDTERIERIRDLSLIKHSIPSKKWKILNIRLEYDKIEESSIEGIVAIRDGVLTSLRLLSSGTFQIIDLGSQFNYINTGTFMSIDISRISIGRCKGDFCLNTEMSHRLQVSWPIIRRIMESDSHYLRLPAQRLFEGSERKKPEDAILDYSIGLERLLTSGVENELSYRFALRGATILSWEFGNKGSFFKYLKNFYDLRSFIIHGSRREVPKLTPADASSIGEDFLRKIWWWFFTNGFMDEKKGLDDGTKKIDNRILSDISKEDSCRGTRSEWKSE